MKANKIQRLETITVIFLSVILSGCVTGSSIIAGKVRPTINPNEITLYIDSPIQYETIGIVEASGEVISSKQSIQNKVINELKSQAAKLGANGVLLTNTSVQSSKGLGGEMVTAQGKAIYVIQE